MTQWRSMKSWNDPHVRIRPVYSLSCEKVIDAPARRSYIRSLSPSRSGVLHRAVRERPRDLGRPPGAAAPRRRGAVFGG
jgi:hypothetical protein